MSTDAVILLIFTIALIWGGLAASALHLKRHPSSDFSGLDHLDDPEEVERQRAKEIENQYGGYYSERYSK